MIERLIKIGFAVVFLIVALMLVKCNHDCNQRGGALVQGTFGPVCVEVK